MMSGSDDHYLQYSTVTGYFKQDDPATEPKGFDYVRTIMIWSFVLVTLLVTFTQATTNLGLIDREYDTDAEYDPEKKQTQWQRFEYHISQLNEESSSKVQYKLFYC